MRHGRSATLVVGVFGVLACSDPARPSRPASIELLTTAPAIGIAGEVLADSIVFRVLDEDARPLRGAIVQVNVRAGGGSVMPVAPRTGSDGSARVAWTLGKTAGENVLEATVDSFRLAPLVVRGTAGPPARVLLEPKGASINAISFRMTLNAQVTDRYGNQVDQTPALSWSTVDPSIAFVDGNGIVEARANGQAAIVARTPDGLTDTAFVRVRQIAAHIAASASKTVASIGDTVRAHIVAADSAGIAMSAELVHWSLSDTTVATVDSTGGLRLRGVGPVIVRATSGDARAEVMLWAETTTQLAVGGSHSCVLTVRGEVYCWGSNRSGELGTGNTESRATPTRVATDVRFISILAAGDHACGLANLGAAYCWGWNGNGQLGNGQLENSQNGVSPYSTTPDRVEGGLAFQRLSTSQFHVCGLTQSKAAYCWGHNSFGALGRGNRKATSVPIPVGSPGTYLKVHAGDFVTCGQRADGRQDCWGRVRWFADSMEVLVPTPVSTYQPFINYDIGVLGGCALTASGTGYCWGWNAHGQIGDGSRIDRAAPVPIISGFAWKSITRGGVHTCGLASDGQAYCWGAAQDGKLGTGQETGWVMSPVAVAGGHRFVQIEAGAYHTCGLTTSDDILCWGFNANGELGDGTTISRSMPVRVVDWPGR